MLQLKPFQKIALSALESTTADSNHVLCIAPTGSGKSLIYEKAASVSGRRTLLITPLVALARQQFQQLKKQGIPVALGAGGGTAWGNGAISESDDKGPPSGRSGVWIMSPESLNYESKLQLLKKWNPNFLVVDECHCLWEWGEFRPAFLRVPDLIHSLSIPTSLWLTATLPFNARLQLKKALVQPLIELGQFELPARLRLLIQKVTWENRTQALLNWIQKLSGAGLIFVPTRESARRVSRLMQAYGKSTVIYHGGLSIEERKNTEKLILDKIPDLVVATSAFGMGMDYSHLKYVILWQAPTSLLSLVQTIGRVGRQTNQSHGPAETELDRAIVLWDDEDFRMLEWTLSGSAQRKKELLALLEFLKTPCCRRTALKKYFDHVNDPTPCGNCDICQPSN